MTIQTVGGKLQLVGEAELGAMNWLGTYGCFSHEADRACIN